MKNRFYGDINDYIKYGILDILSKKYTSIGINWYLTDDQHGNPKHGNDIRYLNKRDKWGICNPRILPLLEQRVIANQRNIAFCKTDGVINFQAEHADKLPDNAPRSIYQNERRVWHSNALKTLNDCDLVFFDPDIGIKSRLASDPVRASEYCELNEITDYNWCDWLIVLFLGRLRRFKQLRKNPIVISAAQNGKKVMVFLYGGMALLYISDAIQARILSQVFEEWDTKVETKILVP
jgi:hypothetical protein